jgi:hypothetical protein
VQRCVFAVTAAIALVLAMFIPPSHAGEPGRAFNSPSGNIHCYGYLDPPWVNVSCTVDKRAWRHVPERRKKNCIGDWIPYELSVGRHGVQIGSCRSDAVPYCTTGVCRALPFGSAIRIGPIRCTSAQNGMTCRSGNGRGAGFRIAYEGYTAWRH